MVAVVGRDEIRNALQGVIDPELRRSIVELDMVRSIELSPNGVVDVTVSLTTPGCPIRSHFQAAVADRVAKLDGVTHVNVYFDVLSDEQKSALQRKLGRGSLPDGALAQVANVLCVGSGKGGVGKSTLTANLAAALAHFTLHAHARFAHLALEAFAGGGAAALEAAQLGLGPGRRRIAGNRLVDARHHAVACGQRGADGDQHGALGVVAEVARAAVARHGHA